jgi:glycopeptide antibiotics resistance protein
MGLLGMGLLFVVYPLFLALSKKHILIIAWIYVITILIVVSFAIEIGQGYTGTGNMDLDDIISGLAGFMLLFVIFAVIRGFLLLIGGLFKKEPDDDDSRFSSGR